MYPFCHHIVHEGQNILIPGCMGTAAMGLDNCTCKHPGVKNAEIRKRKIQIDKLKEEIHQLEMQNINYEH